MVFVLNVVIEISLISNIEKHIEKHIEKIVPQFQVAHGGGGEIAKKYFTLVLSTFFFIGLGIGSYSKGFFGKTLMIQNVWVTTF